MQRPSVCVGLFTSSSSRRSSSRALLVKSSRLPWSVPDWLLQFRIVRAASRKAIAAEERRRALLDADGPYSAFPSVDLWPEARGPGVYEGPHPIAATPAPGQLEVALRLVERWGGVVVHPDDALTWSSPLQNDPPDLSTLPPAPVPLAAALVRLARQAVAAPAQGAPVDPAAFGPASEVARHLTSLPGGLTVRPGRIVWAVPQTRGRNRQVVWHVDDRAPWPQACAVATRAVQMGAINPKAAVR